MATTKSKVSVGVGAGVIAIALPVVAMWEGLRLNPYLDPVGIPTVCYGETAVLMRSYSQEECKAMLLESLAKHGQDIEPCIPPEIPDMVRAASLSFAYNVGAKQFCGSTMAKKLKAGDIPGACAELSRWVYAGGKQLPGLVKRRAMERAMCEGKQ